MVRHYHRGGAIAPFLGDRYLRIGTPRPFRELELGWALEERGIPTPAHLAAAVYPAGIWYRGDLVTRHVPGAVDLAAVLFPGRSLDGRARSGGHDAPGGTHGTTERPAVGGAAGEAEGAAPSADIDPASAMRAVGRLFRRLHDAGVHHPDLNLKNLLIRGGEAADALVLDLDGARLRDTTGRAARTRMVARFWRSARKWEKATGAELGPSLEAAFEAGYRP